jgi:hypothetical protein
MVNMQRENNDRVLSPDEVNDLEDQRIERLNKAGIDEKEVLDSGSDHMNIWNSYFNENITRGKDDVNFTIRDQWTAVERSEFSRLFKPAMTFNKLYDNVKKLVGEERKNKPDLIVRSLTGKASQDQINLRADLVRTISYQSQNDLVYQAAYKSALMMGFGAFQICLDYESPLSFNQVVRYETIPDPTRTAFDPTALKPHKGDGNYCFRNYVFTREEFFATYPYVTNPVSYVDPYMLLDFQWTTRDTITVADYYRKEWFPLIIYKLSNGMVVTKEEWEQLQKKLHLQEKIAEGSEVANILAKDRPRIVDKRQTQDYRVMHYRMIRDQIIDFSEWPSKQLPIIFVDGDSYWLEGRQYTKSFIHEARDAQKLLNYSRSETAAELKNRRREQWMATPDNIKGNEQQWRNPEVQAGALIAQPDPKTGQMPIKSPAWDINQGLFATSQAATQDIREILGYSEAESMQSRDISGEAKRQRQIESSMSAYVFRDNLNQAIEQGGRVVNDLLNHIFGEEERHFVVAKRDGRTEPLVINQRMNDGTIANQLGEGDFDVEIDTGPSFAVQKEVALEFFQQTIAANPQTFPLIADLWAKNLDIQYMPQVAERFKTLVPPQVLAQEEGKQLPPQPPSPQDQMMQMEMQSKQAEIQERMQQLQLKQQQQEIEKMRLMMDAKELAEKMKNDRQQQHVDMMKTDMDYSAKIAKIWADLHQDRTSRESIAK